LSAALLIEGVVDRDVGWRSKVRPPTMRAAVERLEAQGPLTGARASSQDAPTGLRKVREGASQAPGAVASRVYPTCALNKPISG